ncbi:Phage head-tail joining protein [compost metagenome]
MTLQDGDLQHRIRFERKVIARDPLGGDGVVTWELAADAWAQATNNLGATTEAVAAGAERYREQVRFDIRPRQVEPGWRIVHRGRNFDIKSIALSNDRSEVAIIAIAGVSDG